MLIVILMGPHGPSTKSYLSSARDWSYISVRPTLNTKNSFTTAKQGSKYKKESPTKVFLKIAFCSGLKPPHFVGEILMGCILYIFFGCVVQTKRLQRIDNVQIAFPCEQSAKYISRMVVHRNIPSQSVFALICASVLESLLSGTVPTWVQLRNSSFCRIGSNCLTKILRKGVVH